MHHSKSSMSKAITPSLPSWRGVAILGAMSITYLATVSYSIYESRHLDDPVSSMDLQKSIFSKSHINETNAKIAFLKGIASQRAITYKDLKNLDMELYNHMVRLEQLKTLDNYNPPK